MKWPSVDDPYATHLPVLQSIAEKVPLWRVLEYGGGDYSTPFFLSHPKLERLVTVEDDPEWRARIEEKYADPRLVVTEKVPEPLGACTLIFIDNGTSIRQRVEVIRAVLSEPHPIVVIHDAEIPAYEQAIRESGQPFTVFKALTPHTAVVDPA